MKRIFSLAYLSASRLNPVQAMDVAAQTGYACVGLRLWPNAPGEPCQALLGQPALMREALAAQRDTQVGVFDVEIIRIQADFDLPRWVRLLEAGAALQAQAVLVAGDDPDRARLADHLAQLCERMRPFGLCANLEFMPWTAVPNAATAQALLHAAGSPVNARILVDALHFGRSRTSLEDIRAIPSHWLQYAQINDAMAGLGFSKDELIHTARCARLLPGEGTVDLLGLFQALPPDLPISVEIVNQAREALSTPAQWARQCLLASQAVLARLYPEQA